MCSLILAFVIRFLDNTLSRMSVSGISGIVSVSVAKKDWIVTYMVGISEDSCVIRRKATLPFSFVLCNNSVTFWLVSGVRSK